MENRQLKRIVHNDVPQVSISSLPAVIKFFQKNSSTSETWDSNYGIDNLAYTFDLPDEAYVTGATGSYSELKYILTKLLYPTVSRTYLTENFYIYEIPDYSNQAMTPGYVDFVPLVYYAGKKIPQKYIGTIRSYTKKVVYLLISKEIDEVIDDIDIIISYKFYAETTSGTESLKTISANTDGTFTIKISDNGYYSGNETLRIYDSTGMEISNRYYTTIDNTNNSTYRLNTQHEYYKRLYNNKYNYSTTNKTYNNIYQSIDFTIIIDPYITSLTKIQYKFSNDGPRYFYLTGNGTTWTNTNLSRYNGIQDFEVYVDGLKKIVLLDYTVTKDSVGRITSVNNITSDGTVEVIPYYNHRRTDNFVVNCTGSNISNFPIRNFLYTNKLYNWAYTSNNFDAMLYEDGKFIGELTENTEHNISIPSYTFNTGTTYEIIFKDCGDITLDPTITFTPTETTNFTEVEIDGTDYVLGNKYTIMSDPKLNTPSTINDTVVTAADIIFYNSDDKNILLGDTEIGVSTIDDKKYLYNTTIPQTVETTISNFITNNMTYCVTDNAIGYITRKKSMDAIRDNYLLLVNNSTVTLATGTKDTKIPYYSGMFIYIESADTIIDIDYLSTDNYIVSKDYNISSDTTKFISLPVIQADTNNTAISSFIYRGTEKSFKYYIFQ